MLARARYREGSVAEGHKWKLQILKGEQFISETVTKQIREHTKNDSLTWTEAIDRYRSVLYTVTQQTHRPQINTVSLHKSSPNNQPSTSSRGGIFYECTQNIVFVLIVIFLFSASLPGHQLFKQRTRRKAKKCGS